MLVVANAPSMSRHASQYTDRELYAALAEIAQVANPDQPERCTQRAFDDARADARQPTCPTARQICTRLNAVRDTSKRTWREWLDVALNESTNFHARSAAKRGTVKQPPETIRVSAMFALRLARAEGDHHRTQAAYGAWREERAVLLGSRLQDVLPTDRQVRRAFGSWPEALAAIRD